MGNCLTQKTNGDTLWFCWFSIMITNYQYKSYMFRCSRIGISLKPTVNNSSIFLHSIFEHITVFSKVAVNLWCHYESCLIQSTLYIHRKYETLGLHFMCQQGAQMVHDQMLSMSVTLRQTSLKTRYYNVITTNEN